MKTQDVVLRNKEGQIVDNDEIVFLSTDLEKRYPVRRIVRWALNKTAKTLDADCAGMGGEGDFGIDAFWNYFNDSFSELTAELSGDREFEIMLVELFNL